MVSVAWDGTDPLTLHAPNLSEERTSAKTEGGERLSHMVICKERDSEVCGH
jgi:hypothetical protein